MDREEPDGLSSIVVSQRDTAGHSTHTHTHTHTHP